MDKYKEEYKVIKKENRVNFKFATYLNKYAPKNYRLHSYDFSIEKSGDIKFYILYELEKIIIE